MEDVISACEKRDTWQATGRHSKGYLVAIMRGRDSVVQGQLRFVRGKLES